MPASTSPPAPLRPKSIPTFASWHSSRPASRQPVGEEGGPCCNGNILLTILSHIGNRIGVSHLRRFHAPQFFPCLCVEGAEHAVQRSSNERETSRRRHWATAQAGTTSLDPGRDSFHRSKGDLPGDIARVHIDRGQPAPRRRPAGPTLHRERTTVSRTHSGSRTSE